MQGLLYKTIQGMEKQHPGLIGFGHECGEGFRAVRQFVIIVHQSSDRVNEYPKVTWGLIPPAHPNQTCGTAPLMVQSLWNDEKPV